MITCNRIQHFLVKLITDGGWCADIVTITVDEAVCGRAGMDGVQSAAGGSSVEEGVHQELEWEGGVSPWSSLRLN